MRGEEKPPQGFCTHHQLALVPLPCWRHLSRLEVQRRVAMMIAEIETEAAARYRAEGGKPLGRAGILRQNPQDRPASSSRSPAPLVHAASRRARREIRIVYYLFVAAFRAAAERLKLGCKDAVFPGAPVPGGTQAALQYTRRLTGAWHRPRVAPSPGGTARRRNRRRSSGLGAHQRCHGRTSRDR